VEVGSVGRVDGRPGARLRRGLRVGRRIARLDEAVQVLPVLVRANVALIGGVHVSLLKRLLQGMELCNGVDS